MGSLFCGVRAAAAVCDAAIYGSQAVRSIGAYLCTAAQRQFGRPSMRVEAAPYDFLHRAGEITDQRRAPRSASAAAGRVPRRAL